MPARLNGAPSRALAQSRGGLCGVGHPGFGPFPAAVASTITMTAVRSAVRSTQLGGNRKGGRKARQALLDLAAHAVSRQLTAALALQERIRRL
jgi:hypothetical protein